MKKIKKWVYFAFIFQVILLTTNAYANNILYKISIIKNQKYDEISFFTSHFLHYKDITINKKQDLKIKLLQTTLFLQSKLKLLSNNIININYTDNTLNDLIIFFSLKPNFSYTFKVKNYKINNKHILKICLYHKKKANIDKAKHKFRIIIDPGHGGEDSGAISHSGNYEKDIVFAISRYLYQLLKNDVQIIPFLTRKDDYYLSLMQRLNFAHRNKGDIFISIHADGFNNSSAQGASVFVLSDRGASSVLAKILARHENNIDRFIGGINLSNKDSTLASMIIDLSQFATKKFSFILAKEVLYNIKQNTMLHKNFVEKAGFLVLKSPDIPSILVEVGFISNYIDEQQLLSPIFQQRIANAIFYGIKSYIRKIANI